MNEIQELRETAERLRSVDYEEGYFIGKVYEAIFDRKPIDFTSLADDVEGIANAFADLLEEHANALELLPSDKNGCPCSLGDKVWLRGKKMRVVAVSHKGWVDLREWERTDGKGARWHEAKKVSHQKPSELRMLMYGLEDLLAMAVSTSKGQPERIGEEVMGKARGYLARAHVLGVESALEKKEAEPC